MWWMENVLKYMYTIYFEKKEQEEGGIKDGGKWKKDEEKEKFIV